jgi:hypothetical protein
MRGHSGWWERDALPYAPYIGHVSPAVILLDDGSLLAMGRLRGVPHELAAAAERNAAARLLNGLFPSIEGPATFSPGETSDSSPRPVSPLRARMIEDMSVRAL